MKALDLSNVTGSISAPFLKTTGDHVTNGLKEISERVGVDYVPNQWNNSSTVVLISGALNGKGVVFYNGEVFDLFSSIVAVSTDYFVIQNSYIVSDPVKYSDGNFYSQHKNRIMTNQTSIIGSTGVQLGAVKYMERFISDLDLVLPMTSSGAGGNQFLIGSTNTSGVPAVNIFWSVVKTKQGGSGQFVKVDVNYNVVRFKDVNVVVSDNCSLSIDLSSLWNATNTSTNPFYANGLQEVCTASGGLSMIIGVHRSRVAYNITPNLLNIRLAVMKADGVTYQGATSITAIDSTFTAGSFDRITGSFTFFIKL